MRSALLVAILANGACTSQTQMLDDIAILDPATVQGMLKQCTREVPRADDAGWIPHLDQIRRMEAVLPSSISAEIKAVAPGLGDMPNGWVRQYVGITREGRRYIYGNFAPRWSVEQVSWVHRGKWKSEPWIVCDGGPAHFGAEYDIEENRITHIAFNDSA